MAKRKAPAIDVAGLVIGSRDSHPHLRRAKCKMFTAAAQQRFFDALALTCNVKLAAAHAGVYPSTVYTHRAKDPLFGGRWREALMAGYDRLEAMTLEHGGAGVALEPADPDRAAEAMPAPPPFDFAKAMELLKHYRLVRDGRAKVPGMRARPVSAAETDAAITRILDNMERRGRTPDAAGPSGEAGE